MVKLTVTHGGFQPGSAVLAGVSQGWPSILSSLKTLLETGAPLAGGLTARRRSTRVPDAARVPDAGQALIRYSDDTRYSGGSASTAYVPDRPEGPPAVMLCAMSIAITEDHRALAATVSDFLTKNESRAAARAILETADEPNAPFFKEAADLGWLGLHVPEELGGSGYGLEETVVVAEELGRALAPGAFVPTLIASAVLVAAGTDDVKARLLPGLADGSTLGAAALGGDVTASDGKLSGSAGTVLGAGLADVILVPVGDDVAVVDAKGAGVTVDDAEEPRHHPSRRVASRSTGRAATSSRARAGRSSTSPARSSPPKPSASPARAPTSPPSTPRCACSSAARSPCTRASSTTAPTWPSPPSWPRPRCGTPLARRSPAWRRPVHVRRRRRRRARRAGRQPVRQPRHAGPRRHRLHVGARLPRLHAPGDGAARRARRGRRRRPTSST